MFVREKDKFKPITQVYTVTESIQIQKLNAHKEDIQKISTNLYIEIIQQVRQQLHRLSTLITSTAYYSQSTS